MVRFNENNEIIREDEYRAILVGLQLSEDISYSMDELEELAEADNVTVLGRMVQVLDRPNTATFIGKGKAQELAEMCEAMEADTVIFNDELSGIQTRNLEDITGVRIIDRTVLILDIFAGRATTREGRLQVELAQLKYRLPRLTGLGRSLSRLGGGIGTRGPGEKKLETDRRHIARRMDDIRAELKRLAGTRKTQRSEREKSGIPVVALVGYTNSGKSTVMNRLLDMSEREDKSVLSKDMLFATLDPQSRRIELERGCEFLLTDTVGFVSRLPHDLVEAFKSTLEEVRYADLLLHIVDASFEGRDFQMDVTADVIGQLGAGDKDRLLVYNKMDIAGSDMMDDGGGAVYISAKTGSGLDDLVARIKDKLFGGRRAAELLIPYDRGDILSYLHENAEIGPTEYEEGGTRIRGRFSESDLRRLAPYITEGGYE